MCLGTPPCMHRCTAQRRNSQHMRGVSISRHPEHAQIQHKQTPCFCLVLTTFQQSVPSTINTSSFLLPPFSPPTSVSGGHGMDPFSALARASWKHWQSSSRRHHFTGVGNPSRIPSRWYQRFFRAQAKESCEKQGYREHAFHHTHFSPFTVCLCIVSRNLA
jgi:hypothetical protein